MKRYLVIAGMAGSIMIAACKDSTGPGNNAPYVASISQINVPAQAAVFDTIRVDFIYTVRGCDSSMVEIRQGGNQVQFTAIGFPTQQFCVQDLIGSSRFHYIVYPPHNVPLSILFTEPTGGDSVRTVTPSA